MNARIIVGLTLTLTLPLAPASGIVLAERERWLRPNRGYGATAAPVAR